MTSGPSERDQGRPFGVPPGHQPVAVVLNFMNPVGARRRLVDRGSEAGFNELGVGGKPLTHTLDQHATNLGGPAQSRIIGGTAVTQRTP
jgi:hypothetical protein